MERPKCMPPVLNCDGTFISAPSFKIAGRVNERLARKMDAAKILDELESGLWDLDETGCHEPNEWSKRKRLWVNQAFHYGRGQE